MPKHGLAFPLLLVASLLLYPQLGDAVVYAQDLDEELLQSLKTPADKLLDQAMGGKERQEEATSDKQALPGENDRQQNDSPDEETSQPLPGALRDLDQALIAAQKSGKPVFVLVSGEDCPWCYRLKREMQTSPAKEEIARWTLVEIDLDANPAAGKRLGVAALPALRLLRPTGVKIADHDGYLESAELADWLKQQLRASQVADEDLLVEDQPLTPSGVVGLVQHLEERDPLVREAAIRRLQAAPDLTADLLIDAFRDGGLAKRLAILEVLDQWDAPIDGIDPWQTESIDEAKLAKLTEWNSGRKTGGSPAARQLSPAELAEAYAQIDRLLTMTPADGAPIAARLARHAEQLLPEVYRRLQEAETDEARERLLTLRYRLAASNALTLRFPGGLERLASRDIQIRRQAAEQLAGLATSTEQSLLLELFSDPDPLIREIALRGLEQQGGEAATEALVRLLADPEPNVRAAVLKQLAEQKTESLVDDVAKYVAQEKDPDLLVHAARYLREIPTESSARALFPLLDHESWQVRAEAAESLRSQLDGDLSENLELTADIYAGLIRLLDDDEPFVASRAVEAFSRQISDVAMDKMFALVEKHPVLAPQVIQKLSSGNENQAKIAAKFQELAKSPNSSIRAAAVRGLFRTSPERLNQWGLPALQDEDSAVRQAAAAAIFSNLEQKRAEMAQKQERLGESSGVSGRSASGLSAALGFLLGNAKNDEPAAADQPEVEQAAPEEQDPDAASWWDRRLTDFASGKGRPSYFNEFVEPLEKMLAADDVNERVIAALCLTALGRSDEALPVIQKRVTENPHSLTQAGAVLPWVPWKVRRRLFEEFAALATGAEQQEALVMAVASAPDPRAAQLIWPLVGKDVDDLGLAYSVYRALLYAYTGERYWYGRDVPPEVKSAIEADVMPRAEQGTEMEALVSLLLLSDVDKSAAFTVASQIVADPQRPATLRDDAFQISLLYAPQPQRNELAKAALGEEDVRRQRLGIVTLVDPDDSDLYRIRDRFFISSRSSTIYSTSEQGPIIPMPPDGVTIADIESFLKHEDPQVRAYAGYVLATLGDRRGLEPLLKYWRAEGEDRSGDLNELVYRAIAKLNAGDQVETLREIYPTLDDYDMDEFYWTIRIMSGDDVLRLRKEIRDTYGADILR